MVTPENTTAVIAEEDRALLSDAFYHAISSDSNNTTL